MSDAKSPSRPIAQSPRSAAMRLDIMPERPCVPVGEVISLPVLLRLLSPAYCHNCSSVRPCSPPPQRLCRSLGSSTLPSW